MIDLLSFRSPTPLQELHDDLLEKAGVRLFVKRDDLIHPEVSGSKWRKLKYNLKEVVELGFQHILTFGGAFSNHLYAVAAAGSELGIRTIGIVRGEQPVKESPTLQFCRSKGMELHFVSREQYKLRNAPEYLLELKQKFKNPYIIPEGGTTRLALPGVAELVTEVEGQLSVKPDFYCVAAGTGGTAAGLLTAGVPVIAFAALKGGEFLGADIAALTSEYSKAVQLDLQTGYHFGGYAKYNTELLGFLADFKSKFDIQLEQVYTGKMFFGIFDLIQQGYFPKGTTLVAVHTGGLQGLLRK